jgi:ketosteroid isomerase-like protein
VTVYHGEDSIHVMSTNDFDEFMKSRTAASQAFVTGEVGPLNNVSTSVSPATIFGPKGDCIQGADQVNAANAAGAKMFAPGSETYFEVMQQSVSGELAFWTGIQRARVRMQGKSEPIQMDLRVTEVFRRQNGSWKLVHRHADPFKPSDEKK